MDYKKMAVAVALGMAGGITMSLVHRRMKERQRHREELLAAKQDEVQSFLSLTPGQEKKLLEALSVAPPDPTHVRLDCDLVSKRRRRTVRRKTRFELIDMENA